MYKAHQFHDAADVPRPASVSSGDKARFSRAFFIRVSFIRYDERREEEQGNEKHKPPQPRAGAGAHLRAPTHGMPPRTAAEPQRDQKNF